MTELQRLKVSIFCRFHLCFLFQCVKINKNHRVDSQTEPLSSIFQKESLKKVKNKGVMTFIKKVCFDNFSKKKNPGQKDNLKSRKNVEASLTHPYIQPIIFVVVLLCHETWRKVKKQPYYQLQTDYPNIPFP